MFNEKRTEVYKGVEYDARHGGAFDRGSADSWYSRPRIPHMFTGATHSSTKITESDMTREQIAEYLAGYEWNEEFGGKKEW